MKKLLLLFLALSAIACGRIETGHVGVRTDFNKTINTQEVPPGFYGAVLTSVDEFVVKETELALNDLRPKAKDNLSLADLDISVFYTVKADQVADQLIKYSRMAVRANGYWYPSFSLVERVSRGAVYEMISQFESLTIHAKRSDLEESIKAKIQAELDKSDKDVFTISKVIVRQITTDPALEEAIQGAVRVEKQIEAKENEIKLAKSEAERKRVEAEGTARANMILANSLTDKFLQYESIKAQREFAQQGTHTVLMPLGTSPLVNVGR